MMRWCHVFLEEGFRCDPFWPVRGCLGSWVTWPDEWILRQLINSHQRWCTKMIFTPWPCGQTLALTPCSGSARLDTEWPARCDLMEKSGVSPGLKDNGWGHWYNTPSITIPDVCAVPANISQMKRLLLLSSLQMTLLCLRWPRSCVCLQWIVVGKCFKGVTSWGNHLIKINIAIIAWCTMKDFNF